MQKNKTYIITPLETSAYYERRQRMIKYGVAMAIRIICIIFLLIVPGYFKFIALSAAVILPYWAVVIANTPIRKKQDFQPVYKKELPAGNINE